jgi:hypothetical protein
MSKMIDDRTLEHWRALDLLFVLTKLGCYAKRDCTFRPSKASKTIRYHVNANGRDWEFLLTGPKFWDTRAGKGGGGAIDLTMYLFQLDFRHAVRTLNDALADAQPSTQSSRVKNGAMLSAHDHTELDDGEA